MWRCSIVAATLLLATQGYAEEMNEIETRAEIARLTVEVSQRLTEIAKLEATLTVDDLGLDGFCPVSLTTKGRWVRGQAKYERKFEGATYRFASKKCRNQFAKNPARFAPRLGGHDSVIWLDQGERVKGLREFGWFYGDTIVLFANEMSLRKFESNPDRYMFGSEGTARPSRQDRTKGRKRRDG